jgi:predicted ATPase/class 3 adenylate cyclase/DNA-binding CsgD family transcriptional regulator
MGNERALHSVLPSGVVTFLLSDVEDSTGLWRGHLDAAEVMRRQSEIIADAVARHGGVRPLEQGEGDSTVAAFTRPSAALAAAIEAQSVLAAEAPSSGVRVRVRMAIHTGESEQRDDHTYGGEAIIRCARIRDLARGGQVLVSNATAVLSADRLPPDAALIEAGRCSLDGFDRPEAVYQLRHPNLDATSASFHSTKRSALPEWPTSLVGREREVAEIRGLLAQACIVTITGVGGAGKTRVGHAVASELASAYSDGVAWTELAAVSSAADVAAAVADACGVQLVAGMTADLVLVHHLRNREMLVVLDNCEHLLDACAALADGIVRQAPRVRILATSREPLGTDGEITWRIPSLTLPADGADSVEAMATSDAARLFVARGQAARPDFCVDADTAPLVARVCRRLDGMPLSIELAAARLRNLSLRQLAEGLDHRFRLLTGGARSAVARQRTLLASVEWSYDLLDEQERFVFRQLGIFAAPFTLDAAEAIVESDTIDRLEVLDFLARLVDKSLVQQIGERYRLLETLRQFALDRAGDADELIALRDRHLAWFCQRSRAWSLDRNLATHAVLDEVRVEVPDLIAALEWSIDPHGRPAVDLLHVLGVHQSTTHPGSGGVTTLSTKALSCYAEGSAEWMTALAPVAVALYFAGDLGWVPAARRALDVIGDGLDPLVRSRVEFAASFGVASLGKEEGFAGLERALADSRAGGCRALEMHISAVLAVLHVDNGDCAAARPLLTWIERHLPADAWLRSLSELTRISVAAYTGELADARALVLTAVDSGLQPRATYDAIMAPIGLWMQDAALCERAVEVTHGTSPGGLFDLLHHLPGVYVALVRGDLERARAITTECIERAGMHSTRLWLWCELGQIAWSLGDFSAAEAIVRDVMPQLAGTSLYFLTALAERLRSQLAAARGDYAQAETHAHEALACAAAHELNLAAVDTLETLALILGATDRATEAARLLGAVDAYRERSAYRWRYPRQQGEIDALRVRLEPEPITEGARLSLAEAVAYAQRGRGERGRPSHGWDSLTPSERRVVDLVAAGLPNGEIAAKLFVSLATVKTHLVHIYTKLDLRTRAELAATATRRALGEPARPR